MAGRAVPPELLSLMNGVHPPLPRRWTLSEAVERAALLAISNITAPYEIEVGEASYKTLPDLFIDLGFTGKAGAEVGEAIEKVWKVVDGGRNFSFGSLGTKGKIAAGAAGLALIAAGPIGLAMAGSATAVGAAAITSSLAAFGPGGMAGGLAMLGGLATTGSVLTTAAATVRDNPRSSLDPSSIAIRVAIAYAHKRLDQDYESDLWYDLADAESNQAAKVNMLVAYSDEKSPDLKNQTEVLELFQRLIKFMTEEKLAPAVVRAALASTGGD